MDFNRISPQAKIASSYRLSQQQVNAMIHSLLLAGIDPLEITDEEVDVCADAKDSSGLTDRQQYLRSVAYLRRANNIVRQTLETR